MIGLGLILQRKISTSDHLHGLKVLILSLALPATIFVALLNVELSENMLIFPMMALLINGILLGTTYLNKYLFPSIGKARHRTLMMLLPSLAPGLSCFPFLSEYLGEESVALAALADVGNKLFVLLLLYLLAMHWYHQFSSSKEDESKSKIKQLLVALISEPINMVMIVALVMLGFGLNLQTLPDSVSGVILRLSSIMAPLILLFIGLAVKINRKDFGLILRLLTVRSGLLFILSGLFIMFVPELSMPTMLLAIVFPQSSCSFWPFAHMSSVNGMEDGPHKTFDVGFALSVLAVSLPFSTVVILAVLSFPSFALDPFHLIGFGATAMTFASIPQLIARLRSVALKNMVIEENTPNQKEMAVKEVMAEAS